MVRTIKVDFDQSAELSDLISRRMDQQRWAFNMAVREKLNDPRTTKYDLNKMLTKWRNEKKWLVHDKDALAAGRKEACNNRVQRTGLRQDDKHHQGHKDDAAVTTGCRGPGFARAWTRWRSS